MLVSARAHKHTETQTKAVLTFVGTKVHLSPNSFATSSPLLVGKSAMVTLAPFRTRRAAVALPSPEAPPVTIAMTFDIDLISLLTAAMVFALLQ